MKKMDSGYIFIMTLFMIAGMMAAATYVYIRGSIYIPFMKFVVQREQAKMLAYGAIEIGIQQLAQFDIEKDSPDQNTVMLPTDGKATQPKATSDILKRLYARIMPSINRWQLFELKKEIDGIAGTVRICITCEEGKFDINQLYDFKRKLFVNPTDQRPIPVELLELLFKRIESATGTKNLLASLQQYLKKRGYPLNDITQLLSIKEFAPFINQLFYEPTVEKKAKEKPTLYLADLFTVHSGKATIEPRLLSDSWLGVLQMKQAVRSEIEKRTELVKKLIKQFKQTAVWKSDWNTQLKPIYQKELQSLPKGIDSLLGVQFDPRRFTMRIESTVEGVVQRLLVLVERGEEFVREKAAYDVHIKKLYWL